MFFIGIYAFSYLALLIQHFQFKEEICENFFTLISLFIWMNVLVYTKFGFFKFQCAVTVWNLYIFYHSTYGSFSPTYLYVSFVLRPQWQEGSGGGYGPSWLLVARGVNRCLPAGPGQVMLIICHLYDWKKKKKLYVTWRRKEKKYLYGYLGMFLQLVIICETKFSLYHAIVLLGLFYSD